MRKKSEIAYLTVVGISLTTLLAYAYTSYEHLPFAKISNKKIIFYSDEELVYYFNVEQGNNFKVDFNSFFENEFSLPEVAHYSFNYNIGSEIIKKFQKRAKQLTESGSYFKKFYNGTFIDTYSFISYQNCFCLKSQITKFVPPTRAGPSYI